MQFCQFCLHVHVIKTSKVQKAQNLFSHKFSTKVNAPGKCAKFILWLLIFPVHHLLPYIPSSQSVNIREPMWALESSPQAWVGISVPLLLPMWPWAAYFAPSCCCRPKGRWQCFSPVQLWWCGGWCLWKAWFLPTWWFSNLRLSCAWMSVCFLYGEEGLVKWEEDKM